MSESKHSESRLLLATVPTPRVRVLAFNRPGKRNALSQDLIQELLEELSKASSDPDVRAIVITGSATVFSGKGIQDTANLSRSSC